jgi:hypothetical protein
MQRFLERIHSWNGRRQFLGLRLVSGRSYSIESRRDVCMLATHLQYTYVYSCPIFIA